MLNFFQINEREAVGTDCSSKNFLTLAEQLIFSDSIIERYKDQKTCLVVMKKNTMKKKIDSQDASITVEDGNCETENENFSVKELKDKAFIKNKLTEHIEEIENNPKIRKDWKPFVDKNSNELFRILEDAILIMGETSVDMNKENELRDDATIFLTDKRGFSREENIKQMERVNVTEILDKTDGVKKRFNKTLETLGETTFKKITISRKKSATTYLSCECSALQSFFVFIINSLIS